MKKLFLAPAVAAMVFLAACGGNQKAENAESTETTTPTEAPAEAAPAIPGIENVAVTNHIELEAHDNMTFTGGDLFKVKAGEEITLTLKNVGQLPKESMGHNLVILTPGTDHAEFGGEAFKAKAEDYIPATFASSIVAHTKLLGPGESDTIKFKFDTPGVYTYVCSFPGHWGTMHGTIVVE
jgi:azurin